MAKALFVVLNPGKPLFMSLETGLDGPDLPTSHQIG